MVMAFEVDLNIFRGPLDLLLYLVRRHEVTPEEIDISSVTNQYLALLETTGRPDLDAVGDFLDLVTALIELKARSVLPKDQDHDEGEPIPDVGDELVQRLLEYRQYREGATILAERSIRWQDRVPRQGVDLAELSVDPGQQPISEVELWDLVSAHGRLVREQRRSGPTSIVYDDTPIHVYIRRLHGQLSAAGAMTLDEVFATGMAKSAMIGIFLAALELARHHGVVIEQREGEIDITIRPGPDFAAALSQVSSTFDEPQSPPEPE